MKHVQFTASRRISAGEVVSIDDSGLVIPGADGRYLVGTALTNSRRAGDGSLVVDVKFAVGFFDEPDRAEIFEEQAKLSLARVRAHEAIVRKRARRAVRRKKRGA